MHMHEIAWMSATKREIYKLKTHWQILHETYYVPGPLDAP